MIMERARSALSVKDRSFVDNAIPNVRPPWFGPYLQEVHIPAGTALQSSIAASAFGQPDGLLQYQILERIDPKYFGPGVLIP